MALELGQAYRHVWRHTSGKSVHQAAVRNTVCASSVGRGHLNAVDDHAPVCALVVDLRDAVRPSAVAGLVVAIVVDAIKRVAFWARPHIRKERAEVALPPRAHCDAASAVVWECDVSGREAARLSRFPRPELSGFGAAEAVFSEGLRHSLSVIARATDSPAANKRVRLNAGGVPAFTSAQPLHPSAWGGVSIDDSQPPERLSGEVS